MRLNEGDGHRNSAASQDETPTRSVGFCVQSPTQHRLHTARIKKAPPAGGAKGLILMHR